jgi:hypothetical protein
MMISIGSSPSGARLWADAGKPASAAYLIAALVR